MVTVLTGANDYMVQQKLQALRHAHSEQYGEFGLEQFDGAECTLAQLLDAVASVPFLADKRMVIVHNLSTNKDITEHIEQLIDAVLDTTELVIVEAKFDKRLSLYKTLKKRTEFTEFAELDERGLATWASTYVREQGGNIKPNDAAYLVARVGTNQIGLKHELDKLLSYDESISRATIDMLTDLLPRSSVFELLDAAFRGDRQRTMSLYAEQRKQQVEPQAIMGMIAWQLHIIAVVKYNEQDGADTIAKHAKLNPFVVRKTMDITRNLSKGQVKDLVNRALDLDTRLKSETLDADDAVQHFLLSI